MSAPVSHDPLVVNTRGGGVWQRRAVTSDGRGLYAVAGSCGCPEFLLVPLAELAEHGIVGSAHVLPVPVGPEPRSEVERLAQQVVELQGLLEQAGRDTVRAQRERDVIRERVSEPYGCTYCGVAKRFHGRRYIGGAGMHGWERPSDEQVKDRMLARRAARFTSLSDRLAKLLVARTEELLAAEARIGELEAERHSTNESLDNAIRELRNRPALPSRFSATPAEVDAYLRTILAEDTYLKFQQAIGEHALAEVVEDAGMVRAAADNEGLYNADWREGWDDAIERVDPDLCGPAPSKLIVLVDPASSEAGESRG